ncbi:MAG: hypothetical protein OHK0015_50370 [Chloroflexi bacterium OHK40]
MLHAGAAAPPPVLDGEARDRLPYQREHTRLELQPAWRRAGHGGGLREQSRGVHADGVRMLAAA